MKENIPHWASIFIILVSLAYLLEEGLFFALIIAGVMIFSTNMCIKLSKKIKKNKHIAAGCGVVFGLVGLLCYWMYYRIVLHKAKNKQGIPRLGCE